LPGHTWKKHDERRLSSPQVKELALLYVGPMLVADIHKVHRLITNGGKRLLDLKVYRYPDTPYSYVAILSSLHRGYS
jgi:hypothetical protein